MTRNGAPTLRLTPSIVTCPSSITSSRADCVLAEARLISSASTTFEKIGPLWNSHSPAFWSYTEMPVMSPGSMSGVNWMRLLTPSTLSEMARASEVLPVPGKSSSSTWPSLIMAVNISSMTCCLPSRACSTLATSRPKVSAKRSACSCVIVTGFLGCLSAAYGYEQSSLSASVSETVYSAAASEAVRVKL